MIHVVSFSGGLGSWMAAKRVAEKYGTENLYLVFCDTLIEDPDLYRFLPEAAEDVGGELIWLKDGRDPWKVFEDKRYMGNSRTEHCTEELKIKPFYKWVDNQEQDCVIYLGIDWSESHRLNNARKRRPKYRIEAPLCEPPYLTKTNIIEELSVTGIKLPELYKLGFSHNNCSGACVRAGQGQWAQLYKVRPEVYLRFEKKQRHLMNKIPTTRPFLRMTTDGVMRYLTLYDYRVNYLEKGADVDATDIGGCGCFVED